MKFVELLIFDLDGTLATSGGDIAASVNHTLSVLGRPTLEYSEIMGYIGDGVYRLIEKSVEPQSGEEFNRAMDIFSSHYEIHMMDDTKLYPSVSALLRHFQNKVKVIITNKRHRFAVKMVDALHISDCFNDLIGADTTPYIKPDSRMLLPLFERYRTSADMTAIIGDGINDIMLAKNAGAISCAFLNGLGNRGELLSLEPDYACEDLAEVMELFC